MSLEISPTNSNLGLPYDIQLLIIDEAASNPTLLSVVKALALTHHALREHCQKHIFSTVPYKRYISVLKILRGSPQFARYIQTLVIPTHLLLVHKRVASGVEFLSKLHYLHELRIFKGENWQEFSWLEVRPKLATELLRLVHSPILRSLQIRDIIKFPLQDFLLLGRSPHLTSLKIARLRVADSTDGIDEGHDERQMENLGTSHVSESEEDRVLQSAEGASEGSLHGLPQLLKLSVGMGSRNALKIILGTTPDSPSQGHPLFDLSYIRQLSVVWMGTQGSRAERLLIESSSGVKDLEVWLGYEIPSFKGLSSAILQGSCQVLEKLALWQREDLDAYLLLDNKRPFLGVLKEMKLLAGSVTALSTIVIDFSLDVDDYWGSMRVLREISKQCRKLDKILANREHFPALQKVYLSIVLNIMEDPGSPEENPQQSHKIFAKKAAAYTQQCFANLIAISAMDLKVDLVDSYCRLGN